MAWRFSSRSLAAVVAFLGVALLQGHRRVDAGGMRARLDDASLVAAAGAIRFIEPRLTGGFAYAPWTSSSSRPRVSSEPSEITTAPATSPASAAVATARAAQADTIPRIPSQLFVVAARFEKAAQVDSQPAHLRALGVAKLLLSRSDEALEPLERALAAAPDDPRILTDLAAVLLARSRAPEDTADAVRALNYAERAWRMAPALPEAAFNAALARERLHLRSEARKAWVAYQRLDPGSAWSTEAARHIDALSTETVAQIWPRVKQDLTNRIAAGAAIDAGSLAQRFPQAVREYLHEELLPSWAVAHLAHDATAAARRLTAADALCAALATRGDGTCIRTIARITARRADQLRRLAAAHRDFGAAMKMYREHRIAASESGFAAARGGFIEADSPNALWCDVYLAIIDYRNGRHAASSARLRSASAHVTAPDKAVRGRIAWQMALNDVATEAFTDAVREYRDASAAFRDAGEIENRARIDALLAEAFSNLGSRRDAWQLYDASLGVLDLAHNLSARQAILTAVSIRALDHDAPDAALAFPDEFLGDAAARTEPLAFMDALLSRFATLWRLGQLPAARDELKAARLTLGRILDPAMQQRATGELDFREGRIAIATAPARAIELLTSAIDIFRRQELTSRLPVLFRLRGQAYLRLQDVIAAEGDFLSGIGALEARASLLVDEPLSASAREQIWPLFVELIRMELARARPLHALAYAERAKSYGLESSGLWCGGDRPSVDPKCWLDRLPPRTTGVYYTVLENQLAIWVIRASGITYVAQEISADRLRSIVSDYRQAIGDSRDTSAAGIAATLFDHVIRPVEHLVEANTNLVVFPDDALHAVPFAALRDGRQRRYLIEDHVILVAPSYGRFVADARAASRPFRALEALVVTSPKTSGPISATLPALPGAEAEAEQMAERLDRVRVLKGEGATKRALRGGLAHAEILHIASHARVNARAPWRSYFVLAPDNGARGEELLLMGELARLPLHDLQLAVLAACASADGPIAAGSGGVLSLAHPFLSAGVPNVVASLWPVNDQATRRLFETFYTQLAEGVAPEQALRQAQLTMLRSDNPGLRHPVSWAPFVAIGGRRGHSKLKRGTK